MTPLGAPTPRCAACVTLTVPGDSTESKDKRLCALVGTRQPGEITHPRLLGVAGAGFMQLYAGEHRIPRL
jgi:hypothetical protein